MVLAEDITVARALVRLGRLTEVALAAVGLTTAQYRVLGILTEERAAAGDVAERITVSAGSVTSLINGLIQRSLVLREIDHQDRRRQVLQITEEGRLALSKGDTAVQECLKKLTPYLGIETVDWRSLTLVQWRDALDIKRHGGEDAPSLGEMTRTGVSGSKHRR
jgi:DNA-binding MarR family transcriptional regulator